MDTKIYRLYGLNTAMSMLRPGATWEITNKTFTKWDDPRPCPSWEEIDETMKKIKAFEDSIHTIWLPEQLQEIKNQHQLINIALGKGGTFGNT